MDYGPLSTFRPYHGRPYSGVDIMDYNQLSIFHWPYSEVDTIVHTGPILTFTASGHLPGRPHFLLYLSHFLLQDSCKFPSNFLVQYRPENLLYQLSMWPWHFLVSHT